MKKYLALAAVMLIVAPALIFGAERARADGCVVSAGVTQVGAVITGTAGNDVINCIGVAHGHTINGLAGNDIISAGAGNDTIDGGAGQDTIAGGPGNDTYKYNTTSTGFDQLQEVVGGGADRLDFSGLTATWRATINLSNNLALGSRSIAGSNFNLAGTIAGMETNFENANGGPNADTITGNLANNSLVGNGGGDTINGGAGNDSIDGGSGGDTLNGDAGGDFLTGGTGNDSLNGGSNDDIYTFGNINILLPLENDTVTELAGGGIDTLSFSSLTTAVTANLTVGGPVASHIRRLVNTGAPLEIEAVIGGSGNDTFTGNGLANRFVGFDGNDTINAGDGNDTVFGVDGNDTINGEGGSDQLSGGEGSDSITGGPGNDLFIFFFASVVEADTVIELPGGGTDTLNFRILLASNPIAANLSLDVGIASHTNRIVNTGGAGQAANFENVIGGAGNDAIIGNAAANLLLGNSGNDSIGSGPGNDILLGGAGDDSLAGGDDDDVLDAGAGADTNNGGNGLDICIDGGAGDAGCEA